MFPRSVKLLVAMVLLALGACADFAEAEAEYCFEHPGVCPVVDAGAVSTDGGP